jgi:hypothetical protein
MGPAALYFLWRLRHNTGSKFGFPSAGFGFPSAGFGIPSIRLGFPSKQFGFTSADLEIRRCVWKVVRPLFASGAFQRPSQFTPLRSSDCSAYVPVNSKLQAGAGYGVARIDGGF